MSGGRISTAERVAPGILGRQLRGVMLAVVAVASLGWPATVRAAELNVAALRAAILKLDVKEVVTIRMEQRPEGLIVTGRANRSEDVSAFTLKLATLASSPYGIVQVLERRDWTVRAWVLGGRKRDAVLDFSAVDIKSFEVDMLSDERKSSGTKHEFIEFEIRVRSK